MKVKKAIAYVLAGVMMFEAAGLTASEQAQASVKGKLNVKSVTLATGKSVTLKVKNKGKAKVRWSSSKKKIASVSSRGKVKAKKNNHNSNRFLPWEKEEIKVPCYGFAGGKETSYCGRRQKECQFHCFK